MQKIHLRDFTLVRSIYHRGSVTISVWNKPCLLHCTNTNKHVHVNVHDWSLLNYCKIYCCKCSCICRSWNFSSFCFIKNISNTTIPLFNSENGYTKVQFHVQGDLNNYTKENIVNIVETVADILNCRTDEILVNGVHHSRSFMLVLSMKDIYISKLMTLNERDCCHLIRLRIDYFILNQKIFQLASSKGKRSISGILLYKEICRFLNFIKHLKIQMIFLSTCV